jgi:hypothetical protein
MPSTLFLGTPRDNNEDMVRKGAEPLSAGPVLPCARLTEGNIHRIRAPKGKVARTSGADQLGVRFAHLGNIGRGAI